MKKIIFASIIALAVLGLNSCNSVSYKSVKAKNTTDSASYMIGISIGYNIKQQQIPDINTQLVAKGIEEVLTQDSTISMQEVNEFLQNYFTELQEKMAEDNLEAGRLFLEENKNEEGIVETASGLQYKVIEEGTGESPVLTDRVKCHYEGRLLDGEVFDSSYERGQPAVFSLQGVIRGWTEGLQLMREGAKYEFYIPGDLAYGARPPRGSSIGPNETLVFTVELIEIVKEEPGNE